MTYIVVRQPVVHIPGKFLKVNLSNRSSIAYCFYSDRYIRLSDVVTLQNCAIVHVFRPS